MELRHRLRFPSPGGSRADILSRPDRPRDARKSSRPLRTARRASSADRSPPHAPAPPRSSSQWRHSPTPKSALLSPPTIAPPLPGSPAETLLRASLNHSWHPPRTSICGPSVYSVSPFPSTFPHTSRFLTLHCSRVNSHGRNAYSHHTCRQPCHRPLRTFLH